ncbi:transglycosylase domain-containing protein, partial [Candidatus Roizmanbacteria bacterium]|nr:transglycosylase domain-containing protein [Candidatus Roizmanbacteria bacterium]
VQIERKYSKDEILQMYLNEAPYGGTAWGVESAAKQYFGKKTSELSLVESAILAGLPQRPSYYSPYTGEPGAYIARAEHVLRRMREDGYITSTEEEEAKKQVPAIVFSGRENSFEAPHFVTHVRKLLAKQFGDDLIETGGLRVITTLDSKLQRASEDILREELEKVKTLDVGNGAAMVIDPQSGEILAMVGSKDYNAEQIDEEEGSFGGKFNVATQGLRQPGSALKPIVYATAFENGYTPSSLILDVATEFPGGTDEKPYTPENYDGKFRGPVQMRFALGNSINMTAVKTLALVGLKDFLETAYNMGLTTLEPTQTNMRRFGLSIALGGGEVRLIDLTSAYGVFAAGGISHEPVAILEVKDRSGKTLFKEQQTKGEQVLAPEVSYLISHILSDNNSRLDVFGPSSWLHIPGRTIAVKTGTTDDKRDNWTVGFTKDIVIGVWVGNNDNSPMNPKLASGVTGAAPIWNRIMKEALREYSDGIMDKPENVIALDVDSYGGGLPKDGQEIRSEYFIKGTEPTGISPIYQTVKLSTRQDGKRASPDEIRVHDYKEQDFIVFTEDDPVSGDGKNRWQEGIDKWLEGNGDEKYHPPRETSDVKIEEEKKDEPTKTPTPTPNEDDETTPAPSPTVSLLPTL